MTKPSPPRLETPRIHLPPRSAFQHPHLTRLLSAPAKTPRHPPPPAPAPWGASAVGGSFQKRKLSLAVLEQLPCPAMHPHKVLPFLAE